MSEERLALAMAGSTGGHWVWEPHSDALFVSARTGAGLEELRARIEERLPRPAVEVEALVPYARHDLIDRIHKAGEIVSTEHTGEGTLVRARVNQDLAGELAEFAR